MTTRLGWVVTLLSLACAPGPTPVTGEANPDFGRLVPTDQISGNFLIRQRIEYEYGEESGTFEAVLQKDCQVLTVIGLTPFGLPAFTIVQRGDEVSVESHLSSPLPFPPRYILYDVHRSYFVPISTTPPRDGSVNLKYRGEMVREHWSSGELVERRFGVEDRRGEVIVTYRDGSMPGDSHPDIHLENRRFGYVLDIKTVSRQDLSCP